MNKIGIYKIENIINNKFYIGSTSTIGFEKRWKKHILDLNKNKHHSIYLQRSWNKYGADNFIFSIVEECSKDQCLIREQYYMNYMKPEYNICENAGNTLGYKRSKKSKDKQSKRMNGCGNNFYGKHHTEETKQKLRDINRGNWAGEKNPKYNKGYKIVGNKNPFYGKKHTEETKKLISLTNKGKNISKNHPNFKGIYIFYHNDYGYQECGQCDLVNKYKLSPSHISNICNGKRKTCKGWKCLGKKE